MTKIRRSPMFTRAGRDIIKANNKVLIPFAPFIRRKIRPIRARRIIRNKVGCKKICLFNLKNILSK